MMADKFTFFRSYYEQIRKVPPEARLAIYEAICEYSLNDNEPDFSGEQSIFADLVFTGIKPVIDSGKSKAEAGRRGGLSRTQASLKQNASKLEAEHKQNASKEQASLDKNSKQNASDKEKDKEKDKDRSRNKRFIPPTREEVQAYCAERNSTVNADKFVNYYTSKGWLVGKAPMKDWKAAVRAWEVNDKERQKEAVDKNKFNQGVESHDYNWDDLERELLNA